MILQLTMHKVNLPLVLVMTLPNQNSTGAKQIKHMNVNKKKKLKNYKQQKKQLLLKFKQLASQTKNMLVGSMLRKQFKMSTQLNVKS